ncbi:hypothetical protein KGF56_003263 [Candida oxycetoniae]|uniref:Uncharacterized protein n=1 Tax=Candida oxycetoniae TaxID=497107 RepID=A0AAI9WX96_9ASCO|nr:uncharacterized protein KGF56_003263 [Candida oxycetoniae]KAI3403833.1 hypothetical protein KGF56_003263 [Candida oxycetoniae]
MEGKGASTSSTTTTTNTSSMTSEHTIENDLPSAETKTNLIDLDIQDPQQARSRSLNNADVSGSNVHTEDEDVEDPSHQTDPNSSSNTETEARKETPEWQKFIIKASTFIGYALTTCLFSKIIYLHYFFVRLSYDDETAMKMLDGVFRAQEKAIDDYHKRKRSYETDDDSPPEYQ